MESPLTFCADKETLACFFFNTFRLLEHKQNQEQNNKLDHFSIKEKRPNLSYQRQGWLRVCLGTIHCPCPYCVEVSVQYQHPFKPSAPIACAKITLCH